MATRNGTGVIKVVPAAPPPVATLGEADAVLALAALSQTMRLRVFRALVGAGPVGMTPGVLIELLDLPASTLSFHLKELTLAGLVTQQRQGRSLVYRPSIDQMNALLAYLSAHCCDGEPCGVGLAVSCQSC